MIEYRKQGQRLAVRAKDWNEIARLVNSQVSALPGVAAAFSLPYGQAYLKNTTGSAVVRGGVLGISGPLIDPADNEEEFRTNLAFAGASPSVDTHNGRFAITLEPIKAGKIGRAVIVGLAACTVAVSDAAHGYANIADGQTDKLSSSAARGVPIYTKESGTGDKLAVVILGGQVLRQARGIAFTATTSFTASSASVAASVSSYWDGYSPGSSLTVYNVAASSDYIFEGASGAKGKAEWNDRAARYEIYQMECP